MNGLGGIPESDRDDSLSRPLHACLSLAAKAIPGAATHDSVAVSGRFGAERFHGALDTHHAGLATFQGALDTQQAGLDTFQGALDTHQGALETLQRARDTQHAGLDTFQGAFDVYQEAFDTLHGGLDTHQSGFDAIQAPFDTLQGRFETLQGPIARFQRIRGRDLPRFMVVPAHRTTRSGSPDVIREGAPKHPSVHQRQLASMSARAHAPGSGSHAGSPPPGHRSTVFR